MAAIARVTELEAGGRRAAPAAREELAQFFQAAVLGRPLQAAGLKGPKDRSLRKRRGARPVAKKATRARTFSAWRCPMGGSSTMPEGRARSVAGISRTPSGSRAVSAVRCLIFPSRSPCTWLNTSLRAPLRWCGLDHVGRFPVGGRAPVSTASGPALGVDLHVFQHIPYDRARQLILDMTGAEVSSGTLGWVDQAVAGLTAFDEQLRLLLRSEPVVGLDETGARIAGRLGLVHSACTREPDALHLHD